jgi:acetyltransferase-like isoleucine patch superfamily enzyme
MNDVFEKQLADFVAAGNEVVGRPARISGVFTLTYGKGKNSKLIFEEGCVFNNFSINLEQGDAIFSAGKFSYIRGRYFVGSGSTISIGDKTAINRHLLMTAMEGASITIGKNCLISDVSLSTTDWHSIISLETGDRINPAKDIVVEDSVWLGEGVTINKGVTVGHNSIVGAKSVVTKPIKPNCIAAGIPAKILKEGVTWQRELIPMPSLPADKY